MCLSLQQHTVCLLLLIFLWSQAVAAVAALKATAVVVLAVCVAQKMQRVVAVV
jgi:hypothetical protein